MKIEFTLEDTDQVISAIQETLGDRKLAKIVSFSNENQNLMVKISKLGTSTLTFSCVSQDPLTFELSNEKVALSHRAFRDEVKEKLYQVVKSSGGKVLDT